MKKYYLRTSAGGKLGWGNLFRILIIYDYLKENKKKVYLYVKGNNEVYNFLKKKKINYIKIQKNDLVHENKILKSNGYADVSFIEVLGPTLGLQRIYKKNSKKLVVLDDLLNKKYDCDFLFCCQTKKKHLIKNIKKIYNSFKYFPVSKEFNNYIHKKKKIRKNIKNLIVFLGGGNYSRICILIAKYLNKLKLNVTFLIGNESSMKTKSQLKKINRKFKVLINYTKIADIIFKSDLIICGGGYTKIEAGYLKTPLIPICVQKHQNIVAENFKQIFGINFIKHNEIDNKNLTKLIYDMNYSARKKMSNKFSRYFSLNGLERMLNKISVN